MLKRDSLTLRKVPQEVVAFECYKIMKLHVFLIPKSKNARCESP